MEAFSDVFAIAITLLVIVIVVPTDAGGHLLSALFQSGRCMAYFIAFMSIGLVWIEHNALTEALAAREHRLPAPELLLLLLVASSPTGARDEGVPEPG